MTSFSKTKLPERIERLKTSIMERRGSFPAKPDPFVRAVALWRASDQVKSRVQVRAGYLHEIVKIGGIEIESDWTLAGNHLPTAQVGLDIPCAANPEHRQRLEKLGIQPDKFAAIQDCVERWLQPQPAWCCRLS